jgi:hypothetical protein
LEGAAPTSPLTVHAGSLWRGAGMSQERDRTVYELDQAGRTFYCDSAAYVSWLLATGWTLRDSGQMFKLVQELRTATLYLECE